MHQISTEIHAFNTELSVPLLFIMTMSYLMLFRLIGILLAVVFTSLKAQSGLPIKIP